LRLHLVEALVLGLMAAAAGAALAALVIGNWAYLIDAVKITGAVQSIVVAAAVFMIGVALFYASRPQKPRAR
jgi:hypothetical protein